MPALSAFFHDFFFTSVNRPKFHMQVSDADPYIFCKFYKICVKFIIFQSDGTGTVAFFTKIFNFSEWAQFSHAGFRC